MSDADFRHGLDLVALVQTGPDYSYVEEPTLARQWAVRTPDGEYSINGDQSWTRDGRALTATNWDTDGSLVYPEGSRIVHRDITIGYGPWIDQETQAPIDDERSTFIPKLGQQVRVVKCSLNDPKHVGQVGLLYSIWLDFDSYHVQFAEDRGSCDASEVAPVWQYEEAVTEEPPIGSTVRINQARFRRGSDGNWHEHGSQTYYRLEDDGDWYELGDPDHYSWIEMEQIAKGMGMNIIFISEESPSTFVIGNMITAETGEPPVGSMVQERDGTRYIRDKLGWHFSFAEGNFEWVTMLEYCQGLTLISLPETPLGNLPWSEENLILPERIAFDDPDRCNARHPTNPTVVPCCLRKSHRFKKHWSTTGYPGSNMTWMDEAQPEEPKRNEWQVGDAVSAESPIGFTVRVGQAYFTRRSETRDLAWQSADGWVTWENIREMAKRDGVPVIFVSDGDPACSGCGTCPADFHVHGCYADRGACEEPGEHQEPQPDPQPQTCEVPLSEVREGDLVTVRYRFHEPTTDEPEPGIWATTILEGYGWLKRIDEIKVVRDIKSLPTIIGTVIRATVQGVKGVRAMLSTDGVSTFWLSDTCIGGMNSFKSEDITDFVELLAGESSEK